MQKNLIKRKQSVINTAIEIIDELGLQGLTTKEIAKREGVTEPALYKQFKNKDEIILGVLDEYSKFEIKIMNTVIEQEMKPLEAVFYFAKAYGGYYQGYPQITRVLYSMDMYAYDEVANNKMLEILYRRQAFMKGVVEEGQRQEVMDKGIEAQKLAEMILGIMMSIIFNWKIENTESCLNDKIMVALKWFLRNSNLVEK